MRTPAFAIRRKGLAWSRPQCYLQPAQAVMLVLFFCMGQDLGCEPSTAAAPGNMHGSRWLQWHAQNAANSNSSALTFHFQRYHPQEGSIIGTADGYYVKMRLHNQSYAHAVSELAAKPQCRQLSFNSSLEGKIYQDTQSKHYLYELDSCRLRRLDIAQTRTCLKGRRLVMLGDSVTRYQYTSLIYFLGAGHYQNPYDDGRRSVSNVDHWGHNYDRLYSGVTRQVAEFLGPSGTMSCNCDKSKSMEEWLFTRYDDATAVDYKYVYRYPTWSGAGIAALNWALGQAAGKILGGAQQQGVAAPTAGLSPTGRRLGGRSSKSTRKRKNTTAVPVFPVRVPPTPASRPAPDVVLFNMCAWWGRKNKAGLLGYMREIFQYGKTLMDMLNSGAGGNATRVLSAGQHQLQLVWKSCTVNNDFWDDAAPILDDMARQHGWQVLNVRQVVQAAQRQGLMITWNPSTVHFLQLAYETMNDMLFNIICPET